MTLRTENYSLRLGGGQGTGGNQSEASIRGQRTQDSPNLARIRNDARILSTKQSNLQSSFQPESPNANSSGFVSKSISVNMGKMPISQSSASREFQKQSTAGSKVEEASNYANKYSKPLRYLTQKSLEVATDIDPNTYKTNTYKESSLRSMTSTQATNNGLNNTNRSGFNLNSIGVQTTKHSANTFSNKLEINPSTNPNVIARLNMNFTPDQRSPPPDEMAMVASTKYYKEEIAGFTPSGSRNKFLSNHKNANLPYFDPTKCSSRKNGIVKAYAANTNQGLIRNYNEDRVAIILNIMRPPNYDSKEEWPVCSYFGIYDGHGGTACADFLRDNLHQYVIRDKNFPSNPEQALRNGFMNAERQFTELAQQGPYDLDKSGSCAVVVLIVGDSRAVLSAERGKKIIPLSEDHKPAEEFEKNRILAAGGKIYQSQIPQPPKPGSNTQTMLLGPFRVLPGRLSVSRTFGDIEAKLTKYGGNPHVVIATPDIKSFKVTKEHDFIILGCDGIYDKLENEDVVGIIWEAAQQRKAADIHKQSAVCVETLMKESLVRKTLDNITIVMVTLSGFRHALFPDTKETNKTEITTNNVNTTSAPQMRLISKTTNNTTTTPMANLSTNKLANGTGLNPGGDKLENVPDEPQIRLGYQQKSPQRLKKGNLDELELDKGKFDARIIMSGSMTSKDQRKITSAWTRPRERISDNNSLNVGMNMSYGAQSEAKLNKLNK